jgi:hypothetical protein
MFTWTLTEAQYKAVRDALISGAVAVETLRDETDAAEEPRVHSYYVRQAAELDAAIDALHGARWTHVSTEVA